MSARAVISVFSGIGGLDLGFEKANFEILACIERDQDARQTLLANRPHTKFLEPHDINELCRLLSPQKIGLKQGELAGLIAGPPCQPFSKAALWAKSAVRGLRDPRCSLSAFLTLVQNFLPAFFLIENVPGFIGGKHSVLSTLRSSLKKINSSSGSAYTLTYCILNAADFGVPQRRARALILAYRQDAIFAWPTPTHRNNPVRAFDALRGLQPKVLPEANGKWAELLPSIPEGQNYLWHTPEGGGRPLFGYRTKFWSFLLKLSKAAPSWTIPAQPGPAAGPFHWENRPLAIEEMLRLQSFPAEWKVTGDRRQQVRQVGNATPPLLAEVVAREIGRQLCGQKYSARPALGIRRASAVPPAQRPMPVPAEFVHLEGKHKAHPGPGLGPAPRRRRTLQT